MAKLTPKPSREKTSGASIDDFINAGGGVPQEDSVVEGKTKRVQLRLLESTVENIDELITQRGGGQKTISRHAWIVEAIQEKLRRERGDSNSIEGT